MHKNAESYHNLASVLCPLVLCPDYSPHTSSYLSQKINYTNLFDTHHFKYAVVLFKKFLFTNLYYPQNLEGKKKTRNWSQNGMVVDKK